MENNSCRHLSLRLNYNNPEHLRIMDMLDDLNTDVHKSKNQFILTAISYYMDAMKNGNLTYTAKREQEEREAAFATKDYVDESLAKMAGKVKTEIYEEMIRFLGSMAFGAAANHGLVIQSGESNTSFMPVSGAATDAQSNSVQGSGFPDDTGNAATAEDIADRLGNYENVLSHVMDWSED